MKIRDHVTKLVKASSACSSITSPYSLSCDQKFCYFSRNQINNTCYVCTCVSASPLTPAASALFLLLKDTSVSLAKSLFSPVTSFPTHISLILHSFLLCNYQYGTYYFHYRESSLSIQLNNLEGGPTEPPSPSCTANFWSGTEQSFF